MSYLNLNGLQYFFNKYIKPLMQGKQDTIEGAASTITGSNLTTNRVLVSNGSGKVAVSAVTATELGYLDGVTSGIQGQLNGKQAAVTGAASTITGNNLTASRALVSDGNGKVAASGVTSTELGYLDGVTSGIQSQLNGKQGTVTGGASTITGSNLTANRALVSNGSGKVAVSAVTATELGYLDGVTSGIQGQINALNNNLGNIRINATGSNDDVQINGYSNRQMYVIAVNVGGKNFQVLHVGDTSKSIAHYIIYGNGNLTYFWLEVQSGGVVRFVQSWSTNGGWISSPTYAFTVYQVMGIVAK